MELKCWEIKIIKELLVDETGRKVKFPTRLYRKYGHPVFVVDYNEEDVCYCTRCYFNKWIIVVSKKIVDSWEEEASLWHEVGHIELEEGHKEDFSDEWHGLDCHESQVARTDEVAADWNAVVKHNCGKELMQILQCAAVVDLRDGAVSDCLDRVRRIRKYLKTGDWDAGTEHPVVKSVTNRITRAIGVYMRCRQTRFLGNLLGYFWIKWNIA